MNTNFKNKLPKLTEINSFSSLEAKYSDLQRLKCENTIYLKKSDSFSEKLLPSALLEEYEILEKIGQVKNHVF